MAPITIRFVLIVCALCMVNGKPLDNKPKVTNTNTDTDENAKGPDGSPLPDESLSSKEKSKDKSLSTDIKTDNVQSAEVLDASKQNTFVAFCGTRTSNMDGVNSDTLVFYDSVEYSIGGGFDESTGTFYPPVAGVYLFNFAGKGDAWAIHLKVNGDTKRSVIQNHEGKTGQSSSNSIILNLAVGDRVQTYLSGWGSGLTNASPSDGIFTSFSGALLHAL